MISTLTVGGDANSSLSPIETCQHYRNSTNRLLQHFMNLTTLNILTGLSIIKTEEIYVNCWRGRQQQLKPHWNLAAFPEQYKWSSAAFYENNHSEYFNWLTHYKD